MKKTKSARRALQTHAKNNAQSVKKSILACLSSAFKKGDRVTWTSQAGGYSKKKTGKIVFVLPKDHAPWECGWGDSGFGSTPRNHRSYIIECEKTGKLYWPLVKNLRGAR